METTITLKARTRTGSKARQFLFENPKGRYAMGNQIDNLNIVTDLESNIYVHTNQENLEGTCRICDCSFCREETSNIFETRPERDEKLLISA